MDLFLNAAIAQESWKWSIFKTRDLHFIHLNIHSLQPKTEESWIIAKSTNATIIGISQSKLDESDLEPESQIDKYKILGCDWNWLKKGVASYIRNDLNYNITSVFPCEIKSIFFEILLPNCKPITVEKSITHLFNHIFWKYKMKTWMKFI